MSSKKLLLPRWKALNEPLEKEMATSNSDQMGQDVNLHKRIAMGARLDGSSMGAKEQPKSSSSSKPKVGALMQAKKK
jgi:hypothetical protein